MNSQNNLINDLKKHVVKEEEMKDFATLKLNDQIQLCAKVWTINEKTKESSDISL